MPSSQPISSEIVACVLFNAAGTISGPQPGVTSVVRTGAGVFQINLTRAHAEADRAINVEMLGAVVADRRFAVSTWDANGVQLTVRFAADGGAATDPVLAQVMIYSIGLGQTG